MISQRVFSMFSVVDNGVMVTCSAIGFSVICAKVLLGLGHGYGMA
jgi:hypothetical protein